MALKTARAATREILNHASRFYGANDELTEQLGAAVVLRLADTSWSVRREAPFFVFFYHRRLSSNYGQPGLSGGLADRIAKVGPASAHERVSCSMRAAGRAWRAARARAEWGPARVRWRRRAGARGGHGEGRVARLLAKQTCDDVAHRMQLLHLRQRKNLQLLTTSIPRERGSQLTRKRKSRPQSRRRSKSSTQSSPKSEPWRTP